MKLSIANLAEGKILPINKPASWTSFDVVKKIRSLTGIKKIGHAGTLDPFATGLLLVCIGRATKTVSKLVKLPKEYVAEVEFGYETDTMDLTGEKIKEADPPLLSREGLQPILESFLGQTQQEIPSYSAVKYKGKRLYKSARKGEEVPQLFREITIHDIELLEIRERSIVIRVECGSGTYVRTLARDIARKLDSAGHLRSLVRTQIGDYRLKDAITIEDLQNELAVGSSRCQKERIK
jgi:tRNA pseudouridine55 synthase